MLTEPLHHGRLGGLRRTALRCARRLGVFAALFAAVLGAFAVSPALAAPQQVQVVDTAFEMPGVAVTPGETVTWKHGATTDQHNVHFEDEELGMPRDPTIQPFEVSRTFQGSGTFRYFCDEHGGRGGTGMAGIVYVNQSGTVPGAVPIASFSFSPGTPRAGETVNFNAAGSSDPDPGGSIVRYEWDLDGNGSYETDTGTIPSTSRSYDTTGTRTIGLRVTDKDMRTAATTRSLKVNAVPVASFTVSPNPVLTGQTVTFDGSASSDPDGTIARYEWDLDGDGTFEIDGGTTATTARSYPSPVTLTVGLRVTDNLGVTSLTTRSLQVNAPAQPPADPPPSMMPTPPVFPTPVTCSSLKGAQRTACMQKRCRTLKGAKRAACISRSCRYVKNAKRTACIQKSCRYVAKSKRTSCKRKSCRFLTGTKKRACLRRYSPPRRSGRR